MSSSIINRFAERLRGAAARRRQARLPSISWVVAIAVIGALAYIVSAMIVIPSNETRDYHFANERGAITALSAILLAAASSFSAASLVVLVRANNRGVWLWAILAFAFAFFAFDELLEFHERAGSVIGRYLEPGNFRNWNDVVVILYGVAAILIAIALLPDLLQYRALMEMFVAAFLCYGIHTTIDSTVEPKTMVSVILEESAKLFSAEFLALGAFVGFLGTLWNFKPVKGT